MRTPNLSSSSHSEAWRLAPIYRHSRDPTVFNRTDPFKRSGRWRSYTCPKSYSRGDVTIGGSGNSPNLRSRHRSENCRHANPLVPPTASKSVRLIQRRGGEAIRPITKQGGSAVSRKVDGVLVSPLLHGRGSVLKQPLTGSAWRRCAFAGRPATDRWQSLFSWPRPGGLSSRQVAFA